MQDKLFKIIEESFAKPLLGDELRAKFQARVSLGLFVAERNQEGYEIYQTL